MNFSCHETGLQNDSLFMQFLMVVSNQLAVEKFGFLIMFVPCTLVELGLLVYLCIHM